MTTYRPSKQKLYDVVPCSIAILVLLCIVSVVTAIIVGVLIAKPGLLALNFKTATCVSSHSDYKADMPCDCSGIYSDDPHCKSSFPCYQITVMFEPSREIIKHNESHMYFKNEAVLRETEADFSDPNSQCSFRQCHPDYKKNKVVSEAFRNQYGDTGDSFLCFYNPHNMNQVVAKKRFHSSHILLALILPSSLFLLFLLILVTMCIIQYLKAERKKRQPQTNARSGPRNYLGRDMPAFEPDESVENPQPLPDPFASINDMLSSDSGEKRRCSDVEQDQQHVDNVSYSQVESVEISSVGMEENEEIIQPENQMSTAM